MYRVIVVDDELWSLEGICSLFEWEKEGFSVISATTDSAEALRIIQEKKPDLVLTDIRMPEISGLDLLKMARRNGIRSEFVIISGYAEFEYAQEALREGAVDYLLKPVGRDEAGQLLARIKLCLDEKRITKDMEIYEELACSLGNPYKILETRDFVPEGGHWQAIAFYSQDAMDGRLLSALFQPVNHFILKTGTSKYLAVLNGDAAPGGGIISGLEGCGQLAHLYVGASTVSTDILELARLIREADMAVYSYFINDRSGLVRFDACFNAELEKRTRKLERLVIEKDFEGICSMLEEIRALFEKEGLGMYHVANFWNRLSANLQGRYGSDPVNGRIDFLNYMEIANRFGRLPALMEYLKALLRDICFPDNTHTARNKNYNENIMALVEYVKQNYTRKLSLGELAEKYYLNMSYCCELFKKITGYNFSDYITKMRMEEAARLLQTGNYAANRIADMLGYNDYFYFYKTFKRFHGVSPVQFTERRD